MKVFYCVKDNGAIAKLAARIHLGELPVNSIPSWHQLTQDGFLERSRSEVAGVPVLVGHDLLGTEVYQLKLGQNYTLALNTIYYAAKSNNNLQDWKFISLPEEEPSWSKKISRAFLGLIGWNRFRPDLIRSDLKTIYLRTARIVRQVKEWNQLGKA